METVKEFTDIKAFMRFIMWFDGELKCKSNEVYFKNKLVATFKNKI